MDGEGCVFALVLGIGVAVVGIVFWHVSQARTRFDAMAQRVASRLSGAYRRGGMFQHDEISFRIRDRSAAVTFFRGSKHEAQWTRVGIEARGRSPGTFKMFPEGFGQSLLKLFGAQDVEVGDRGIDAQFVIKSNPESLARVIFRPERRARMIAALGRLSRLGRPLVDLTHESLTVQVFTFHSDEISVLGLVEVAKEMAGHVLEFLSETGIRWVEQPSSPSSGVCQVCGSEMKDRVVQCAKCRTPHHEECWTYTGECSTFACGEARVTK